MKDFNSMIESFAMMADSSLERRRFIAALITISVGSIAGCSRGSDSSPTESPAPPPTESPTPTQTESPTPSPTPTPTTPNQEAVERYEDAIETLIENKETLEEWAESSFEPDMVETLQEQVSSARDALTAAEEAADPSGNLIVKIEQATLVANVQELSLAYYEAVNVFFQLISEASNFGDNELHQRAADTYADANATLDDARQVIEDMGTALDEIDNEALGEPELEYTGEPLDHLDLADRRAIDAAESYATANENLHLAFVQLEEGQEHYENEEFTETREAWEVGRQRTRDSKTAFEEAIDNDFTPQNLRQDSIAKLGVVEEIMNAYDKFVEGAKEAEAGNLEEATNLITEGYNILDQLFE